MAGYSPPRILPSGRLDTVNVELIALRAYEWKQHNNDLSEQVLWARH
jgi:hypothetical protein